MADRLGAQARAHVGDDRHRRHPQAEEPRKDHLRHRGHAHRIRTQKADRPDLGGRLERGAGVPGIDPFRQRQALGLGGRAQAPTQDRIVRMFADKAATQQQLDDVNGQMRVLEKQLESNNAQNVSVDRELDVIGAQLNLAKDNLAKVKEEMAKAKAEEAKVKDKEVKPKATKTKAKRLTAAKVESETTEVKVKEQ